MNSRPQFFSALIYLIIASVCTDCFVWISKTAVLTKLVAEMNSILKHQHDGVSTVVIHTAALKFHSKCCEHVLLCSHDHCLFAPLECVMLNIVNSFQSAATSVMDMPRWRTVYVCSHFELNLVGLLSPCWYNFCTGRLPLVYYNVVELSLISDAICSSFSS